MINHMVGVRSDPFATMPEIVKAPEALPTLPVFSQATISKGHVYVSGTIGMTKEFKLVEGGVKAQTVRFQSFSVLSSTY